MKKIISRVILSMFLIGLIGWCIWIVVIKPCIELSSKYGIIGILIWLLIIAIVTAILYCGILLINWLVDNALDR